MLISTFAERRRRRVAKKEYRRVVKKYYADGGDYRFRYDYDLEPDAVVLDLGGHEGQWASDLYSRYRCTIHIFEPVSAYAQAIEQRFRKNEDIIVHQLGLGARARTETIHVCGASSSLYKKKSVSEQVEIVDVAQWLADNIERPIDLMKINIEGGEYELLERLIEAGLIDSFGDIQVQFHNFAPDADARMEAIQQNLAATHTLTYQYRYVWENWKRKRSGE